MLLFQRLTTTNKLSAIKQQYLINMGLNFLIVPCHYWCNSQIFKISLFSLCLNLIKEVSLIPVFVHEHNRLS